MYHTTPESRARAPANVAYLHPADLEKLGIEPGGPARITSPHGAVVVQTRAECALRPGVVSMSHGWGALPDEEGPEPGVNVNQLTSGNEGRDPINAMPIMTALAVRVEPLTGG